MTIAELKAIVNHCETDHKKRVMVKVKMPNTAASRMQNLKVSGHTPTDCC